MTMLFKRQNGGLPTVLKKAALALNAGATGLASTDGGQPTNVGGQAVIEGVMMRGPKLWSVVVRKPDGLMETLEVPYSGWAKKRPWLGKPFFRGAVVLLESMIVGIKALNFSAEIAAREDEKKDQTNVTESTEEKAKPALGFWALAGTLLFAFALAMLLFVALPHGLSLLIGYFSGFNESSGWFHLFDGLIKFALFIGYVGLIGLIPDIKRVYAYHGAEHQAIYTFEANEPLTAEMASRHPAWHPRCGTAFIFLVLALSILFFTAVFPLFFNAAGGYSFGRMALGIGLKILCMFPLAGLAYEVTRLASKASPKSLWRVILWPGLLMQRLTTRKPDNGQLEVALAALKKAVAA